MSCWCRKCVFAKDTEDPGVIICDNWDSEYYGAEMDKEYDGCEDGVTGAEED